VDDSMLIRHTVCRFLEDSGFVVEAASDGAEAMELLKSRKPQIIVTDLDMPKMTGHELIAALKADKATASIPIVIIAARKDGPAPKMPSASYVIFKDIDVEQQLKKALVAALGKEAIKK